MKKIIAVLLFLTCATGFCESFQESCKKINPDENIYFAQDGTENCVLKGSLGQLYDLSAIGELNKFCEAKGPGHRAQIYNNHYSDETIPLAKNEKRLIVTCWDFSSQK